MTTPIAAQETALVLIEYQNDFISAGGALHDGVKAEIARTGMLGKTRNLVAGARTRGVRVIWSPILFSDGHPELGEAPYGILSGVKATNAFRLNAWGGEQAEGFEVEPGDLVVSGKRGLCAFASTNLDFLLRHNGIRRVALGGFLTNCCVESTMRSAYELGYDVITLTDCTATLSQEQHDAAVSYTYPMFSRPMTSTTFLDDVVG